MIKGFLLTKLVLTGKGLEPAVIEFKTGLNVITGPTSTGKSFIFDCINYMLGGQSLDRKPPEAETYDKIYLEIESNDINYTLERATNGGQYNLFETKYENINSATPTLLLAKLVKENEKNISTFFLNLCNLGNKEIRKNKKGTKVALSFRDICHLSLIPETEITKIESPIFAKGGFQKPKELNVIKFLVTGQDDNSIIAEPDEKIVQYKRGKIEILDELISSFSDKVDTTKSQETEEQLELLEKNILALKKEQSDLLNQFAIYDTRRKEFSKSIFNNETSLEHLNDTLSRSELLKEYYNSDVKRLNSTIEAGLLLSENTLNLTSCPYCHNEMKSVSSEEEIILTITSCEKEAEKIAFLLSEVEESMLLLKNEKESIQRSITDEKKTLLEIEKFIDTNINGSLNKMANSFTELYAKRDEILKTKFKQESIDKFIEFKSEITSSILSKQENIFNELSTSIMYPISQRIYQILKECNYTDLNTVSFSEATFDFVIGSKNRNLSGKGERAITYATFVLALSEYLTTKNYGFGIPVFDSPLVTYRKPNSDGEGISEDLAMDFYRYCATKSSSLQIIIFENEEPPEDILDKVNHIKFTRNKSVGRYGFIPG